tara:strand:+ start:2482 stop:3897 length:1416 start_codon:yes stop_codon:yes gene_type:complete
MKRIVILLFFINYKILFASISINGKVFDYTTSEGIPFINIYIENTTIGVISNSDGNFIINIPSTYKNAVLVFSSIGYETYKIKISDLNTGTSNSIKLKQSTTVLDEVVLNYKKLTANEIVKNAFGNYYKNFPSFPFLSKCFLRHTEKTKTEFKWLVEAAIEVYDPGFNVNPKKIKANVLEVRKSIDNRYIDTLSAYKFYSKYVLKKPNREIWRKDFNLEEVSFKEIEKAIIYHDTYSTLRGWQEKFFYSLFSTDHNKIRYFKQNNSILDGQILSKHTFKLDTVLTYNGDRAYKIKILPNVPPSNLNRFKKNRELPIGWIYIRKKDFAIIELKYSLINNSKNNSVNSNIFGSKIASIYNIKFIEFKGKMYPKFISLATPKGNRFMESLDGLDLESEISDPEIYYYTKQEILFNEFIVDQVEIESALKKQWNDDLFAPRNFNTAFWKNYNILLESEEEQKLINDLEKAKAFKK